MGSDEDSPTTEVGLFHYAVSYRRAPEALLTVRTHATHPDAPVEFLYFHAIELFLKAYLRLKGSTVAELLSLGHQAGKLAHAFKEAGGLVDDEDAALLRIMAETDAVSRARYIATGFFRKPALAALARTAENLEDKVRAELVSAGRTVRCNDDELAVVNARLQRRSTS